MKTSLLFVVCIVMTIMSCNDEDDSQGINSTPEFISFVDAISSLPGETLTFEAGISDPAGIKSINIKYESWFLDKTIFKDSLPDVYELAYDFIVPDDAEMNSVHTIVITAYNVGGNQITKNVVVTLDKDVTNPTIQIVSPTNQSTVLIGDGNEIVLDITVSDAELAEFKIESSVLNETKAISGETYNYIRALDISTLGNYEFAITVTDASGNIRTETISVNVLDELLFEVMYITDVTSNAALNDDLFGVPYSTIASTASTEDGYVFTGKYYSSTPNSEVRFIPQQTAFEPYSFGADPNAMGELILGNDASVSPIVVPGVGYYEITMDLRDQSYVVEPYVPIDTAFDQVYVLGRGVYLDATSSTCVDNSDGSTRCWHFLSGKPFIPDSNNPYLWTIDVTAQDQPDDNGANGFILNANPEGWGPFWRVDANDPSVTIPNAGANYVFDDSSLNKDYTFVFDTHLNRLVVKNR
ncbi:hypothetical protein SAMN04487987_105191 [Algibacter pectinivorans]|uniref:Uncharacterized protein n=2 Tax=Algibacter pectinivorans TaxID=870482 RepID=A0A1I1Q4P2_9FLAO|nr:hypothetical protein SAMN04487987_105191 [Algibacter pectinivorans]